MATTSKARAESSTAPTTDSRSAIRPGATLAEAVAQLAPFFKEDGEEDRGRTVLVALDPSSPDADVVVGDGGHAVLSARAREAILECVRRESLGQFEDANGRTRTIVVPVDGPSTATWALVRTDTADAGDRRSEAEHAASLLSVWLNRNDPAGEPRTTTTEQLLAESLAKATGSLGERAAAIADALRSSIDAELVVVGWKEKPTAAPRVLAVASPTERPLDSEALQLVGEVLDEAVVRERPVRWQSGDEGERPLLRTRARLGAVIDANRIESLPLVDESGTDRGVLLVGRASSARLSGPLDSSDNRLGTVLGRHLDLASRAQPNAVSRAVSAVRRVRWGAWTVAAVATLVLLAWPVAYGVECDCVLEPVRRRYVAAPFDGVLARVHVKPGDPVRAGQLLAEMDGRELRLELSERDAEYNRAAQNRRSHAAAQEFGEARLAALEMERVDAERQLLEGRSRQLHIESALDGIVLAGEFDKAEGVRLERGQSLFEIGPLDRMVVEVEIPASEIAYVDEGREVTVRLEHDAGADLRGTLSRIRPRAEIRSDEHVFVGEFEVTNSSGLLRPGLRGRASVRESTRPLGWVLFHGPWNRLRLGWIGWWS